MADLKDRLYDILLEHIYDVSSYTRVAVMKTWASIIQAQCLPIEKLIPVTQLAIDRLQDKTVMVRRSAMQVSYNIVCFDVNMYFSEEMSI